MTCLAWLLALLLLLATPPSLLWCCCNVDCGFFRVQVTGCSANVAGATVHVTLGGVDVAGSPCTTNSSGYCDITIPSTGTYGITVTPPAGFDTPSGVIRVVSTCVTGVKNVSFILTPSTGYSCTAPCCDEAGPPYQDVSYPTTITFNDGIGNVTCSGGGATRNWYGSATRTAAHAVDLSYHPAGTIFCGTDAPGPVKVFFWVGCVGPVGGGYQFEVAVGFFGGKWVSPANPPCGTGCGTFGLCVLGQEDPACGCTSGAANCNGPFDPASGNWTYGVGGAISGTATCPGTFSGSGTITGSFTGANGPAAVELGNVYGGTTSVSIPVSFTS